MGNNYIGISDPDLCYKAFDITDEVLAFMLPDHAGIRVYLPDTGLVRLEYKDRYRGMWYWNYRIVKKSENNDCPYYTGTVPVHDLVGLTTIPKPARYKNKAKRFRRA